MWVKVSLASFEIRYWIQVQKAGQKIKHALRYWQMAMTKFKANLIDLQTVTKINLLYCASILYKVKTGTWGIHKWNIHRNPNPWLFKSLFQSLFLWPRSFLPAYFHWLEWHVLGEFERTKPSCKPTCSHNVFVSFSNCVSAGMRWDTSSAYLTTLENGKRPSKYWDKKKVHTRH